MAKNVGFAISTSDEHILKANAEEKGIGSLDSAKATADALAIESRVLKWLNEFFGNAVDQGHDSSGDLVGDLTVEKNEDVIEKSIDLVESLSTTSGTLPMSDSDLFDGLNYPEIWDVSVYFWDDRTDDLGFKSNSATEVLPKLLSDIKTAGNTFFDRKALKRNIASLKPESWDDVEHFAVLDFINEDLPLKDSCIALLDAMGIDVPADINVNWEVDVLPVVSESVGIPNVSVAYIDGGLAIIYTGPENDLTESLG